MPIRIISTGPVTPAHKRDIALKYAKGEILAFLDDDAYPRPDWLKNAVRHFQDDSVAAVGGPAITPNNDSLRQKASGLIYSNFLVSGQFIYRYLPKHRIEVDDYPSCNLLVRKSVMLELGGFDTGFWPGEDTKLCLDIVKKLKKKIIYEPQALVWHHRRPVFKPHLKQIANYALHRGYFVKHYPETSLKLSYFIPSIFLLFLVLGPVLAHFFHFLEIGYIFTVSLYLILAFIFSVSNNLYLLVLVFFGIILTHLTYGFFFIKGLISKKLPDSC